MDKDKMAIAFVDGFVGGINKIASNDEDQTKIARFVSLFYDTLSAELEKMAPKQK